MATLDELMKTPEVKTLWKNENIVAIGTTNRDNKLILRCSLREPTLLPSAIEVQGVTYFIESKVTGPIIPY